MITASVIIILLYGSILLWLAIGAGRIKPFEISETEEFNTFSIVIPFRNEEENLGPLCKTLLALDYPADKFQVYFVNDESEDSSVSKIQKKLEGSQINWKILSNRRRSNSPKKDAITLAVSETKDDWVITTDADCFLPSVLLNKYNAYIQQHDPYMVCGPVLIWSSFAGLQSLENMSLQGVTMGSFGWRKPVLCNGANLAFKKEIFEKVKGYAGNDHIASGDDIFLMKKIHGMDQSKVGYLKDRHAVVFTRPVKGIMNIIRQRIRWAKKTGTVKNVLSISLGLMVFITNLWLLVMLAYSIVTGELIIETAFAFAGKITIDEIYIYNLNRFFKSKILSLPVYLSGILYPFLTVLVVVSSWFVGYHWKGRYHRR